MSGRRAAQHEGLYAIRFRTADGEGAGVIAFEDGRIRGGDSRMAYTGRYSVNGPMMSADLVIAEHTDFPALRSLFGPGRFTLAVHGNFAKSPPELIAVSPNALGVELRATLVRLEE